MDYIFLLKLLLSFFIGSIWAITATWAADKYGSKVGGLIGGLPSTGLFSLFFLGWTQSAQFAVQATTIIPIIVGVETVFAICYIFLVKKGFWKALSTSLIVWFGLAGGLLLVKFDNFNLSVIGYILSLILAYWLIEGVLKVESVKGRKILYTPRIILFRGLLSGFIIAFSVVIGKIGGPVVGGMFAGFPAMWLSTIFITYLAHGAVFSAATLKSSVIGVASLVIHSIMVRYTYVPLGIFLGTLASILVSFSSALLIYKIIIVKLR